MTTSNTTTKLLQVGDVIWRTRKGWNHGDRPFVVFKILSDTEALAVPTSTTVDLLGSMPAIKAGRKASWINPVGIARVKRNRYQSTKRLGARDLQLIATAFKIFKRAEPGLYAETFNRVNTVSSPHKTASAALKAWKKEYEAIKAWEEEKGKAWPHRIPTKPAA